MFESPVSLPWAEATERISVTLKPWLLLRNQSGINLSLCTASSLELEDGSPNALQLANGSAWMPGAGEVRLVINKSDFKAASTSALTVLD